MAWEEVTGGIGAPRPGGGEDALLAAILSGEGLNPAQMGSLVGTPEETGTTLQEALLGSVFDLSGSSRDRGRRSTVLPPWAEQLGPDVLRHPDFDPFFGSSSGGDEQVFMGTKKVTKSILGPGQNLEGSTDDRGFQIVGEKTKVKDQTLGVSAVLNMPYTWDEDEVTDAMAKMREAGLNVTTFEQMTAVWSGLVERAAKTYGMSEGKRKVTPWDVLDMHRAEQDAAGSLVDYQNGTKTTTHKTVHDITEGQAWTVVRDTVSRMLGRDPTDQELRDFTYRMNNMAASNPTISETITKYKNGEVVSSNTETETGFSGADMAQASYEEAQDDPEYGAYQASSTYFNAALSALGAIGET